MLTAESRAQFALNFDAAVAEIAVALCAGAALHVAPREELVPVEPLCRLLGARGITHAHAALARGPAAGRGLAAMTVILAGEPASTFLVARLAAGRPVQRLRADRGHGLRHPRPVADGLLLAIGRPIAGVDVLILDAVGEPVAAGAQGEIHLGGIRLARGYLRQRGRRRSASSRARPAPLPYRRSRPPPAAGRGDRLPRPGRPAGLHGHRIEPEEIEAAA
ncbi:MAG: AMP-binding protein [Geminicoccaceae bacterium]